MVSETVNGASGENRTPANALGFNQALYQLSYRCMGLDEGSHHGHRARYLRREGLLIQASACKSSWVVP
jgi:hypothetical protein